MPRFRDRRVSMGLARQSATHCSISCYATTMIVEHRTYTLRPGKTSTYLSLYMCEGMKIQLQYLKQPLGYYTSELGTLNQVIHLWGFDDLNDRVYRRGLLKKDPRWVPYVDKILPLFQHQESRILSPAPFFAPSPVTYQTD
jgi:hypothetical protein